MQSASTAPVSAAPAAPVPAAPAAPVPAANTSTPSGAGVGSGTSAKPTSDQLQWIENFIKQNDVLYYDIPCGSTGTSATQSTGSQTPGGVSTQQGGGGGCGNEGYGSGKRNDQANMQQIKDFLKGKGLSDNAVAGIMGNMMTESAFMPDAVNGGGCSGIVQWCGGRNTAMRSFAQEQGKDWNCLGTQLDFMWHEVTQTGESSVLSSLNSAASPADAATAWAHGYERPAANEYAGRAENATKLANGTVGSSGSSATPASSTSTGSKPQGATGCQVVQSAAAANAAAGTGSTAPGTILSADCASVVATMKQLHDSGKVKYEQDGVAHDVDNCKTGPIACNEGANPNTLRGLDAIATNSGATSIDLWNINTNHGCDQYEHPKGLASDIKQVDGVDCTTDAEQCKKVFDYIIANRDKLNITYAIWYGDYCQQMHKSYGFIECNSDHNNHIHVSFSPAGAADAAPKQ